MFGPSWKFSHFSILSSICVRDQWLQIWMHMSRPQVLSVVYVIVPLNSHNHFILVTISFPWLWGDWRSEKERPLPISQRWSIMEAGLNSIWVGVTSSGSFTSPNRRNLLHWATSLEYQGQRYYVNKRKVKED